MPHAGLVLLEADVLPSTELYFLADARVVGNFRHDRCRLMSAVARSFHLHGEVAVGPDQGHYRLLELDPLQFVGLQLLGVALLGSTEQLLVLQGCLRRFDQLAERADLLQRLVKIVASLLDAIGEQALDILLVLPAECSTGVVGDR